MLKPCDLSLNAFCVESERPMQAKFPAEYTMRFA